MSDPETSDDEHEVLAPIFVDLSDGNSLEHLVGVDLNDHPRRDDQRKQNSGSGRKPTFHLWARSSEARQAWAFSKEMGKPTREKFVKWLHSLPGMSRLVPKSAYMLAQLAKHWWPRLERGADSIQVELCPKAGTTITATFATIESVLQDIVRDVEPSRMRLQPTQDHSGHQSNGLRFRRLLSLAQQGAPEGKRHWPVLQIEVYKDEFERMNKREGKFFKVRFLFFCAKADK
jgi:hypothetical protein